MKSAFRLNSLIILACIIWCNTAVLAEETNLVTEVAVQIGKITKTTLHRYVMAYGMVEPQPEMRGKPAASSKVAAPVTGILTEIHCQEGQQIKKGDLLFELDTRSTDALIAKAKVTVEFAQKNFARKQQLNATDNVSRKLYDEAEQLLQTARKDLLNAQTQRELLQIKAPLSGTVAAIHFKVGEAISLNSILAELLDLHRLDIALHVPSQEAIALRMGQAVDISTASTQVWDNPTSMPIQQGQIIYIGSQIDPLNDTLLVRSTINKNSGLLSGQFVNVRIAVEERARRLTVPIESVVTTEGQSTIALVDGSNAKQKNIKPGLRDGKLIEVEGEGLQAGMSIVTQGAYGLPAETRIRVIK